MASNGAVVFAFVHAVIADPKACDLSIATSTVAATIAWDLPYNANFGMDSHPSRTRSGRIRRDPFVMMSLMVQSAAGLLVAPMVSRYISLVLATNMIADRLGPQKQHQEWMTTAPIFRNEKSLGTTGCQSPSVLWSGT